MHEMAKQALKASVTFADEDFEAKNHLKEMLESPGWKYLTEKLWPEQFKAIHRSAYKARKEDIAWKAIGLMEGHEATIELVKNFVNLVEDREEQMKKEEPQYAPTGVENGTFG